MKAKWLAGMVMAAGPILAYGQAGVSGSDAYRTLSPDIKGYGRDAGWSGGEWQPLHGKPQSITPSAVPLKAPELGWGVAASGIALCLGGRRFCAGGARADDDLMMMTT